MLTYPEADSYAAFNESPTSQTRAASVVMYYPATAASGNWTQWEFNALKSSLEQSNVNRVVYGGVLPNYLSQKRKLVGVLSPMDALINVEDQHDTVDVLFEQSLYYAVKPCTGSTDSAGDLFSFTPSSTNIGMAVNIYRDASQLLSRVYRQAATDIEGATDTVFRYIDERLCNGDFSVCREILKQADITRLPTSLMRSFLAITFAAKNKLPERAAFYNRVFPEMERKRGAAIAHRLLDALK